jgi:hypothetical protein
MQQGDSSSFLFCLFGAAASPSMGKCKGDSSSFVVVFLAAVCSFVQIAAFALKSVQDLGAVSAYVRMTMLSLQVARALKVNRHHVGWGQMTRRGGDKKTLHFLGPSILCAATCGRRVGGALEAAGASCAATRRGSKRCRRRRRSTWRSLMRSSWRASGRRGREWGWALTAAAAASVRPSASLPGRVAR